MTEMVRRRSSELPVTAGGWEPFRLLRDLMRADSIGDPWTALETPRAWIPDFDVKEAKEAYILKADVPGMRESDLKVSLAGNRLTISGTRDEEEKREGEAYYAAERVLGSFSRTFQLPEGADAERVHAELHDGVLTLFLPKRPDVKTRQIPVKAI